MKKARSRPGFRSSEVAQAAGADAFFAGFLAAVVWLLLDLGAAVVVLLCDDDWCFMLESPAAIGALPAGAEADCAKAPKLTAEAMTAAMRVFMECPLMWWKAYEQGSG
jgi:hypothetical protein